jgi:hypothetical protein
MILLGWRGEGSLLSGAIQESKYSEFDAAGRALRSVTGGGTPSTYTTEFEYDLANRIVKERGSVASSRAGTRNTHGLGTQKSGKQLHSGDKVGKLAKLVVDCYAGLNANNPLPIPEQPLGRGRFLRWF